MFKQPNNMIVHQLRNYINRSLWRKTLFVVFLIVNIASCENTDNQEMLNYHIDNGCYEGYFEYQNDHYRCSICFENGTYFERPGQLSTRKNDYCLTAGTYSTESNNLFFEFEFRVFHDAYRQECLLDMHLPGTYEIRNSEVQDSLIFSRGNGDNYIIYKLKKTDPDK